MDHKYRVGTLIYSKYDCLGMIIAICGEPYRCKYLVEWFCQDFYGSYNDEEIDRLTKNLLDKMNED